MRSNAVDSVCRISSGMIERSTPATDASRPINGRARKVLRFSGWASTATADVDGYILEPESFSESLPAYQQNPVLLHNHDSNRVIGRAEGLDIVRGRGLSITGLIDMEDEYARAIGGQVERGYIRGMSVGFKILEEPKRVAGGLLRFPRNRLLEVSVVALPANPEALVGAGAELAEVMRALREATSGVSSDDEVDDEWVDSALANLDSVFAEERRRMLAPWQEALTVARSLRRQGEARTTEMERDVEEVRSNALAASFQRLAAGAESSSPRDQLAARDALRSVLAEVRTIRRSHARTPGR